MTILTEEERKLVRTFHLRGWRTFDITERILETRSNMAYYDINREILQVIADSSKEGKNDNINR
jgi:hypothetical protein